MKGLKILQICLVITGILLLWLVIALVRTATKTMAERKNRPVVVQEQRQEEPAATSSVDRRRLRE